MKRINQLLLIIMCSFYLTVHGQESDKENSSLISQDNSNTKSCCAGGSCCCQGTQTPLGVMTDHVHPKGEWMVSYTYMDMNMMGNHMGTKSAGDATIYKNYDMSPETMQMQMQMVMVMYGLTNKITLMAMGGFTSNYMTMNMNEAMQMMPGMNMPQMSMTQGSASSSYGISDTKLYGLYSLKQTSSDRLIGTLGINLPTGSTSATGLSMYSGTTERLAYMMQMGTGSYSILPGLTYVKSISKFSIGVAGGADIKLNTNSDGYKWGNIYNATIWGSYRILSFMSASLRAEGINAGKITGSDKNILNPNVSTTSNMEFDPTADPRNSGGTWVNAYVGLNFHLNKPVLKNLTAQIEYGIPVYQDLNGTQMAISNNLLAGLAYKF